ncbi:hypothetical protein [Pseudacidovorax intermedius]|uniref:Uncharacterized protein n=1 Tax=Pseudacidovorax intermedius TaxID=433924 RepID=A0A147GP42_9BURK|nr:hypothetical protein [Pseudacidovorax intermedius]KTT15857.1 hypothetical protein NS331_19560 [Pseudacidovorax intermedius]
MILAPIGPMIRPAVRAQVGPRLGMGLDARARRLFTQALGGAMLSVDRPEYLYQANDTTTPVTGYNQPVGRILDQSGKGTHFGQSTTTSRPMRMQDAGGFSYLQVRTDDFLQSLASVDYSAAAYVTTIMAQIRRQSASTGVIYETTAATSNTNGSLGCFQNYAGVAGNIGARSRGTVIGEAQQSGDVLGQKTLITHVASISAPLSRVFVAGAMAETTQSQGTGGYVAAPEYLFARAGTSLYADLDFYAMLQIATAQPLTPQQLYIAQLWCASKMGVKP